MGAPQQVLPESLAHRIITWLGEHPGQHRPRDIARGLTHPWSAPVGRTKSQWTIDVGRECARMAKREQLTSTRGQYGAEYALPEKAPANT